jgi:hypothetical protein
MFSFNFFVYCYVIRLHIFIYRMSSICKMSPIYMGHYKSFCASPYDRNSKVDSNVFFQSTVLQHQNAFLHSNKPIFETVLEIRRSRRSLENMKDLDMILYDFRSKIRW